MNTSQNFRASLVVQYNQRIYSIHCLSVPGLKPTATGLQKNKNEQIFIGHFCGKHAVGAKKKRKCFTFFCRSVFFLATYGNEVRPNLMRDRKRKMTDRKSAVFDRAKSFSFWKQKLSYVRSENRLGFCCGVSGMPTVGIIRNLNIRVPTQLRLVVWGTAPPVPCSSTIVLVGCLST